MLLEIVMPATSPDEPLGTRSVIVCYVNEFRHRIFMVHFYLRPDGVIGASGIPDPKWLFEGGIVYRAVKEICVVKVIIEWERVSAPLVDPRQVPA